MTGITLLWMYKDKEGRALAQEELAKSKVGRSARMAGIKESIHLLDPETVEDQRVTN